MPEVFNFLKKKKNVSLSTHFYILYWGAGQRTGWNWEVLSVFFLLIDIFHFTTSNFGWLYSSLFLCLLEERSGTVISVLTGINFRTEGSQYLQFIFFTFFSVWKLLSLSLYGLYRSIKTEDNLKLVVGLCLSINQSGPKTRKSFCFSAHMRRGYWLRLHHQWLLMPAKYTCFQGCSKNLHRDATAFQIKYNVSLLLFNTSCCLIVLGIKTVGGGFCGREKILLFWSIAMYLHYVSQLRNNTYWI